jgi:hypothetical protein
MHYSIGNYCSGVQNKTTSDNQRKKNLQRREKSHIIPYRQCCMLIGSKLGRFL